jgi:hypothetical protein
MARSDSDAGRRCSLLRDLRAPVLLTVAFFNESNPRGDASGQPLDGVGIVNGFLPSQSVDMADRRKGCGVTRRPGPGLV